MSNGVGYPEGVDEASRKALVIWWTPATNHIEVENLHGMSVYDAAGVLAYALDRAEHALPDPCPAEDNDG